MLSISVITSIFLKIVQQKNNSQTYTVSASQGKIFTIEFFCRFATHFLHLTPPCALLEKKKKLTLSLPLCPLPLFKNKYLHSLCSALLNRLTE